MKRDLEEIRAAHRETVVALATALDLPERHTSLHSQRVRDYALLLADRLGRTGPVERESLAMGALVHDIGKIGISDRILLKAGELDEDEREAMRRHPELGASLLEGIGFLGKAREIVLAHHERFDGTGYPAGLAGDAIPIGARVFSVVDEFDAITTDRPYSAARSCSEASTRIVEASGSHFDPEVVEAFREMPFEAWSEAAARYGTVLRRTCGTSLADPGQLPAPYATRRRMATLESVGKRSL